MAEDNKAIFTKVIIKIKGMSCGACELKIENAVKKLNGIKSVRSDMSKNRAVIYYNKEIISLDDIISCINSLGYEVIKDDAGGNDNKNKGFSIAQLAGITVIIALLWFIINKTGIFNSIPQINDSMSYGILFFIGLLTSIHCIAMCGGINLSQSAVKDIAAPDKNKVAGFIPGLLYNGGRVTAYTVIGGIAGALGSVIKISGIAQGIIVIIAGFFMIIMAVNLLGIFPWLSKITPGMPKFLGNIIYNIKKNNKGPFIIGLLNGLMPCGPLQAMQLYALATGDPFKGALSMFLFSLGTVPLMAGFGAVSVLLNKKFAGRMIKISALLIIFLGISMIGRGFNLAGIDLKGSLPVNRGQDSANISKLESGIQTVSSGMTANSYEPIIVQKGIPVKWTINADIEDLNGCNNPVTVPAFNIRKKLEPGVNVIEFTPDRSGSIVFTCWMGMISSSIKVVDDAAKVDDNDIADIKNSGDRGSSGCTMGNMKYADKGVYIEDRDIKLKATEIKNNIQTVNIVMDNNGFDYNVIVMQKGMTAQWIIYLKENGASNNNLIVPEFNAKINLKTGENPVEFVPESDLGFIGEDGIFKGYVAVVDDLSFYNIEEIRKRIRDYKQGNYNKGPSGCCGG